MERDGDEGGDPGRAAARGLGRGGAGGARAELEVLREALRAGGAGARERFYGARGGFQAVAAALLRGPAAGGLAALPAGDRRALAGELFAAAPASEALLALAGAHAAPRPPSLPRGGRGECARASVVSELLLTRFGPGTGGIAELVASVRDGTQAREWAAALAVVAEGWSGPVPDPAMPAAFAVLSSKSVAAALFAVTAEGGATQGADAFATAYFERLCRRGHARPAALASLCTAGNSTDERGLPALGRTVKGLRGSLAPERFAEALLAVTARCTRKEGKLTADSALERLLEAAGDCPVTNSMRGRLLAGERALPARDLRVLLSWLGRPTASSPECQRERAEALNTLAAGWSAPDYEAACPLRQRHTTRALEWALGAVPEAEWGAGVLSALLPAVGQRFGSGTARVQRHGRRVALALAAAVAPGKPLELPGDGATSEEDDAGEAETETEAGEARALGGQAQGTRKAGGEEQAAQRLSGFGEELPGQGGNDMSWDPDEAVDPFGELRALPGGEEDDDMACNEDTGVDGPFSDDSDDEPHYEPFDLSEGGDAEGRSLPAHLGALIRELRPKSGGVEGPPPGDSDLSALAQVTGMVAQASRREVALFAPDLCSALLALDLPRDDGVAASLEGQRRSALAAVLARAPHEAAERLAEAFFSAHLEAYRRGLVLEAVALAAEQLAGGLLACGTGGATWSASVSSGARAPAVAESRVPESPPPLGTSGKTRIFAPHSLSTLQAQGELSPPRANALEPAARYFVMAFLRGATGGASSATEAAALEDFRLLGHLVVTLGSVVGLLRWSPEAPPLALRVLDFVLDSGLPRHPEAFVRRAALACGTVLVQAASPALVGGGLAATATQAHSPGSGGLSIAAALYRRIDRLYEGAREASAEDTDAEARALAGVLVSSMGRLAEGMQLSAALDDGPQGDGAGRGDTMAARLEQLGALRLDELRLPAFGASGLGGRRGGGGEVRLPDFGRAD